LLSVVKRLNEVTALTSENISNQSSPKSYKEIAPAILKGVYYVVNLQSEKICYKPSSIIKLSNNGFAKIIRT
jgi:L-threonylcarbamoyladenylate synthase